MHKYPPKKHCSKESNSIGNDFNIISFPSSFFIVYSRREIMATLSSQKKKEIIEGAMRIFMRNGIKSVNMDDIAREQGISKKTLYLVVKDKTELIQKGVTTFCKKEDTDIFGIQSQGLNAIEESLEIKKWVLSMIDGIHPTVMYDLEKYYPQISKKLKDHRMNAVYKSLFENIQKGQKEGYYRSDLHADIIIKLYISRIEILFDQSLFPLSEYALSNLYIESFNYHIRGIASEKGIKYLEKKVNKKNNI
jgi:hypothetical protein